MRHDHWRHQTVGCGLRRAQVRKNLHGYIQFFIFGLSAAVGRAADEMTYGDHRLSSFDIYWLYVVDGDTHSEMPVVGAKGGPGCRHDQSVGGLITSGVIR